MLLDVLLDIAPEDGMEGVRHREQLAAGDEFSDEVGWVLHDRRRFDSDRR
jgi:hypothetical protein